MLSWEGPFLVIKVMSDVTYRIQKTSRSKPQVVHADRLKLYEGPVLKAWRYENSVATESHDERVEFSVMRDISVPERVDVSVMKDISGPEENGLCKNNGQKLKSEKSTEGNNNDSNLVVRNADLASTTCTRSIDLTN